MKFLKPLVLLFTLAPLTSLANNDVKTYKEAGKKIMDQIIAGKIDSANLAKDVDTMIAAAVNMTKAYQMKHKAGAKVLQDVIDNVNTMKGQDFDTVQTEWHDLGYFKGKKTDIDLSDEDNEHFTDPMHCIIHPVLVLKAGEAFSKTKDKKHLQSMKEELSEGLEQADNLSSKI